MYYVISDSEGKTLDTFRDADRAEQALLVMVARRPEDESDLLLLAYDEAGEPAGPARLAADVRQERQAVALERMRAAMWYSLTGGHGTATVGSAILGAVTVTGSAAEENDTDGRVEIPA